MGSGEQRSGPMLELLFPLLCKRELLFVIMATSLYYKLYITERETEGKRERELAHLYWNSGGEGSVSCPYQVKTAGGLRVHRCASTRYALFSRLHILSFNGTC